MKVDWDSGLKQTAEGIPASKPVSVPVGTALWDWLSQTFEVSHSNHAIIKSMEGLRGFAAFLVFLVHYDGLIRPYIAAGTSEHQLNRMLWNVGNAGVDLFFVLSGYVIYRLLLKRDWQFKGYMLRRIQRIYPTFLVVFGLYLASSMFFPAESKIPPGPVHAGIYILQNLLFLPGLFDIRPIITVAWSLSYEFFYYLTVPLTIIVTGMSSWPRRWRVLLFVSISVAGFVGNVLLHGEHAQLLMFIAGMLLYEVTDSKAIKMPPLIGIGALLVALTAMPVLEWGPWRYVVLYICFFLLCFDCFSMGGAASRFFSWLPLRWYGNMSYSYYLIHGLTLKAAFTILAIMLPSPAWPGISLLLLLPVFIVTLIPAVTLFVFVEKPFSLKRGT